MNTTKLQPEPEEEFYSQVFTRPTPIPPAGFDVSLLEVGHIRSPAGVIYPETAAYYCTAVWCVEGQFSLYADGQKHVVRQGQFLLLEKGGSIDANADEKTNEAYYLLLDGPRTSAIIQQSGFWGGVFPYIRNPSPWLERIAMEMDKLEKQENLVSSALTLLETVFQDAKQLAPDKRVWEACYYLQHHWNRKGMNVETVLAHLNVSRATLSPRFRKITGQTILEYLMNIRYRNAMRMLLNDYVSVSTIAHRCGFPDADYFSTWFRKRHGQPPSEIKRKVAS